MPIVQKFGNYVYWTFMLSFYVDFSHVFIFLFCTKSYQIQIVSHASIWPKDGATPIHSWSNGHRRVSQTSQISWTRNLP